MASKFAETIITLGYQIDKSPENTQQGHITIFKNCSKSKISIAFNNLEKTILGVQAPLSILTDRKDMVLLVKEFNVMMQEVESFAELSNYKILNNFEGE